MGTPLKEMFGPAVPRRIGAMLREASPGFREREFVRACLEGYDPLPLMARGAKIADAMRKHLPRDYPEAAAAMVRSLGPRLAAPEGHGMAPFLYLPHVLFVARHGLGYFEDSMRAQYELTKRFTAEFSIRAYLQHHREATLERLREWTCDPDFHVRRLVSEGTRPRLPWAPRLADFQRDPRPVLELLEPLRDDPELYVRRSVANNLNDIGKDHPELLYQVARRWLRGADAHRRWVVGHALRSAVRRGEPGALRVLGYRDSSGLVVRDASIEPSRPAIGGSIRVHARIENAGSARQRAVVDLRVHFVKARGGTSPKVFKLRAVDLGAGAAIALSKRISLADMTTRKHYPGQHAVDIVIDGRVVAIGNFGLRALRVKGVSPSRS